MLYFSSKEGVQHLKSPIYINIIEHYYSFIYLSSFVLSTFFFHFAPIYSKVPQKFRNEYILHTCRLQHKLEHLCREIH